jgi:hypothetical protein
MQSQDALRQVAAQLPLGTDPASVRRRVEAMEKLLERSFVIPLINRPVGLDALMGMIPIAGDTIAAAIGLYLVWEARNIGMGKWQLTRMMGNVGFDWLLGLAPLAGDLLDFVFRSNSRNLKIIRRHLDRHHPETMIIEG